MRASQLLNVESRLDSLILGHNSLVRGCIQSAAADGYL